MSLFGLKFSQMILHIETSKLMYNWSFHFEVLHKPTLLPSTFNQSVMKWIVLSHIVFTTIYVYPVTHLHEFFIVFWSFSQQI